MAQKRMTMQVSSQNGTENGNGHIGEATIPDITVVEPEDPPPEFAEVETEDFDVEEAPPLGELGQNRYSEFVEDGDDDGIDSEPLLVKCPARKPNEYDIFRVRPGKKWQMEVRIVDYRGDDPAVSRGFYLIHPKLRQAFGKKGRKHLVVTCVNNNGAMFLWPIKITEGLGDTWYKSALRIVKLAEEVWIKDFASEGNGYGAKRSLREHGDPKWLRADISIT
jgi:hypothetical protein